MTKWTSREAYHHVVESGKGTTQRDAILQSLLVDGPGTAREIAARAKIPEHDATTRCAGLKRDGLVRVVGYSTNESTKRKAIVLDVTALARPYLEGTYSPPRGRRVTIRALERDVLAAARTFTHEPSNMKARADLGRAVFALEAWLKPMEE